MDAHQYLQDIMELDVIHLELVVQVKLNVKQETTVLVVRNMPVEQENIVEPEQHHVLI